MRINAHAHIFNLRSVFTRETLLILLNRLKLEGMPKPILEVLYDRLDQYIDYEIDSDEIFDMLDEKTKATDELTDFFKKLKLGDVSIDLEIDGAVSKLGKSATKYLRDKILDLHDLDEDGEIKQNWLDYLEYLRIALLPSIEKVADEVMSRMKPDDTLIALTMDITDGSDDASLINHQVNETSDAVLAYPGRIFPFYMVNPVRSSHIDLMKDAIENRGFWGVKMYPSLGYPVVSDSMFAVYEYCAESSIPILSHCTNGGFNKNTQTAELASPELWYEVLNEFKSLKVCFGHFGGAGSLIQDKIPADSWTQIIIDLMHEFKGVYADIGYHTLPIMGNKKLGITKKKARQNYANNIKKLLNSVPAGKRILFGTDYWMVRMVTEDDDFWSFFEKMFTKNQFRKLSETNPVEYLGLPTAKVPADLLIDKHLSFFSAKKMRVQREPLKWLKDAALKRLGPDRAFVSIGTGPSWSTNNYIHYFLYEYLSGTGQFRQADMDAKLPFEEYGRFKLANLRYWDTSPEPNIFEVTIRGVASDINKIYRKRYKKWVSYNKKDGVTETVARKRLIAALHNPDWYVYQLAELCDKLYIFKSEIPKGDDS